MPLLAGSFDTDCPPGPSEALCRLRTLRVRQAYTLAAVAIASVVAGVAMFALRPAADGPAFAPAVGWQFAIWGAIDLIFAALGIAQSVKANRIPPTPQAEADEFLAAENLLRSLRFNHRLNILWLLIAAALLTWAAAAQSPALAGHGMGVGVQGGFLLVFDLVYARRFYALMTAPPM